MVHSVVAHIASLFRSARGLQLRGQRETSFPSPTRQRQGLISAIPPRNKLFQAESGQIFLALRRVT